MAWTDLQTLDYRTAWRHQEYLLERLAGEKPAGDSHAGYLLLTEHPHVYTLGKNGKQENMLLDAIQLRAREAELIRVDRGGDITYHGPGQLVAYPVVRLDVMETGIREYIRRMEEVVIRCIGAYGLKGDRMEGATGVWLDAQAPSARKICAIGVRCSRSVTMHGFALNVNTDLSYFNHIHPCGFADKGVTSLEREIGKKAGMDEVKQLVLLHFGEIFGTELTKDDGIIEKPII
jgi:lipoyl(octanoyl) transferase